MAKQKPGVYDRVLECAKEEFLSKGFLDASLRTIAQEAGTSTGSIYTRFGDKEGLFRAIVEPVVDEFRAMFREIQESFHQLDDETQRAEMGQYTAPLESHLLVHQVVDGIGLVAVCDDGLVAENTYRSVNDKVRIHHLGGVERLGADTFAILNENAVAAVLTSAHDKVSGDCLLTVRGLADDYSSAVICKGIQFLVKLNVVHV